MIDENTGRRRVLLKLSGEAFGGGQLGVNPDVVGQIAREIAAAVDRVEVSIVVGGGNFFRGAELSQRGMDRSRADYMGMLGTVMNCLALQDFLEQAGIDTRVQTAITMGQVAEPYIPRRAIRHLQKGRVVISAIAEEIAEVVRAGTQVAVVVGGGNFFRGAELSQSGMSRDRADYMGMLGTVMNAIALQEFCEKAGVPTRVQSAINMAQVAEPYIPRRAERHLEKGRVVIFGAGSGMPYFSTDTVAAQRALEIGAEVLLMGKQGVDGVYDKDPNVHADATKFVRLTHDEFLQKDLKVADATAISLARDNKLNIVFFNLSEPGNIARAVAGEAIGTQVSAN